ncbi:hypothetical protein TrRE_jg12834 [Triparma retinervis]|uniref:Protein tweety homolog n=1 Tax=Triparma retinervis TaxID=2557542 RepID=A0A9W7FH62_9STRA|nr:hypothetical protein TrRE_jg12834 [Triparma retinervis]
MDEYHPQPYVPCSETGIEAAYCPIIELHSLPRVDWLTFSTVPSDFPDEFEPIPRSYLSGVAFYPSIIVVLSVVFATVSFFFGVCCCCNCSGRGKEEKVDKVTKRTPLIILLVLLFLFAASSGVGGYSVFKGLDLAQGYFDDLVGSLDTLADDGADLGDQTDLLKTSFTNYITVCPLAETLQEDIDAYSEAVTAFTDEARALPPFLDGVNELFQEYGLYGAPALAVPLVFVLNNIFLTTLGCSTSFRKRACSCRRLIYISNLTGFITVVLLGLFAAAELGFGIFFSDFCIEPNRNMVSLASVYGTETQVDITKYYTLCEGVNPMEEKLDEADAALVTFRDQLHTHLHSLCPQDGNEFYDALIASIDESRSIIPGVVEDTSCEVLNPHIQDLVYSSYCERFVPGVAAMSFSMLFTMGFMLAVIVTGRQFAERIAEDEGSDKMELVGVGSENGREDERENFAVTPY